MAVFSQDHHPHWPTSSLRVQRCSADLTQVDVQMAKDQHDSFDLVFPNEHRHSTGKRNHPRIHLLRLLFICREASKADTPSSLKALFGRSKRSLAVEGENCHSGNRPVSISGKVPVHAFMNSTRSSTCCSVRFNFLTFSLRCGLACPPRLYH